MIDKLFQSIFLPDDYCQRVNAELLLKAKELEVRRLEAENENLRLKQKCKCSDYQSN